MKRALKLSALAPAVLAAGLFASLAPAAEPAQQVSGEAVTNSTLRERFGLNESSSASISRLIKDAVEAKLIKPLDPTTAPRYMKYVPIWA